MGPKPLCRLLLVFAAGILLAGCGEAQNPGISGAGAVASAFGGTAGSGAGSSADGAASGGTGSGGPNRTAALNMLIRVANTYIPDGGKTGAPIEVWVGAPDAGGKKLMTVAYGAVSRYFPPEISDYLGQGAPDGPSPYTLNIFPVGVKSAAALLIDQSEDSAPGQKLTMAVGPNSPGARGATITVSADDLGSNPKSGGFTYVSIPQAPAGQAVLQLNAAALQDRPGMSESSGGLTPSAVDGRCLPYFDLDSAGMQPTSTLHDMSSDVVELFGGTQSLDYVVPPASPIRINQVKDQEGIPAACRDTPVFGPVDPKLTTGERAYGILYGATLSTARLLVVPVG